MKSAPAPSGPGLPRPASASPSAAPGGRLARALSWGAIALAGALWLWVAFALHPIGDHYTESDFYGGYAAGARAIEHGHVDPGRYGVIGPGYEFALALAGLVVRDLFSAGKLLSVLSALALLVVWRRAVALRLGARAAAWTVALVAASPVFTRYAWSATTDMLGASLQLATWGALLAARGFALGAAAGALAAAATLTRYNALYLLPAGALLLGPMRARDERAAGAARRGRSALAGFAAGVLAVSVPWLSLAAHDGHLPGRTLFSHYSFYSSADGQRNEQDEPVARADTLDWRASRSLARSIREEPARLGAFWLSNLARHARRDASELLSPLLAALAVLGALLAARRADRAALARLALPGALAFVALLAAFYSDRYRLALVPLYAALAGSVAALSLPAGAWARVTRVVLALALGGALALELARNVEAQRAVLAQQPTDVLAVAPALAAAAPPGGAVMSRKGHIGYYSGRPVVPFPRLTTLAALGDWAHRSQARFLYFSWYEAQLRPEFLWMLDTTAAVPGMRVVAASAHPPAVAWRLGPEFGREPAWLSDPFERRVHEARARAQVLPESLLAEDHAVLACAAMLDGRADVALEQARRAIAARGDLGLAWVAQGWAQGETGREEEALDSFARALALDPGDADARRALGALGARVAEREARGGGIAARDGALLARIRELSRRYPAAPDSLARRAAP